MTRYRMVEKEEIEKLLGALHGAANALTAFLARAPVLVQEFETPTAPPTATPPTAGGHVAPSKRPSLASVIYENVDLPKFTPRDAYDRIKGKYAFKGNRYIDSIRTALIGDKRFTRNDDATFSKAA